MSIWKKIAEEIDFVEYVNLNEAAAMDVNWDMSDVTIIKGPSKGPPPDGGGSGRTAPGSSKIEQIGEPVPGGKSKSEDGKPNGDKDKDKNDDKEGGGSAGGEGDDKVDGKEGGKKDPNKKGEWEKGTGEKIDPITTLDDHSIMQKSDGTSLNNTFKEIHEQMSRIEGTKNPTQWKGAAGDKFRGYLTKNIVKAVRISPVEKIKQELKAFKEEISKKMQDDETYQLSILSGSSQGGKSQINRPVEIKDMDNDKESAILFMCVDTSGSMGDEEFETVFEWLREIANFFKSDASGSGGIPGRVFIIEYDTKVYAPIREYKNDDEPKHKEGEEKYKMRGGGGNAVNEVYKFLNQHFLKSEQRRNLVTHKFVFDETKEGLFDNRGKKNFYKIEQEIETTYAKNDDRIEQIKKLKARQFKYGDVLREHTDYANVPFLLFFTDGYDDVPTAFGPLYRNNLGNILYIITSKAWIGNMRPRNFIYSEIHTEQDTFASAFDTDGNVIDSGQGSRW